ncbi:cbb3-type cytochrome oxidase assembly protein CcoS [Thalassotalea nanhaiensis]|uniref:Cbb3-type cytochrome oxidase assembly protein CcoS n=1 Tax=Thalassotalea nanhaiensis TaxID=3065648 RepID=A0ABY9TDI6_9GAMM|nr:cbb3-type cytochrome oxidase assembly protein CcoS [Colwelliaceae bacterium SQ345]
MSVIYILIPIAIIFTAIAIYLFFWAVKTEQFDDLEKQGMSILFDDEPTTDKTKPTKSETTKSNDEHTPSNTDQ